MRHRRPVTNTNPASRVYIYIYSDASLHSNEPLRPYCRFNNASVRFSRETRVLCENVVACHAKISSPRREAAGGARREVASATGPFTSTVNRVHRAREFQYQLFPFFSLPLFSVFFSFFFFIREKFHCNNGNFSWSFDIGTFRI